MNYSSLHTAHVELLSRCDGASAVDGQGYSKFDHEFGKHLAQSDPRRWSGRKARMAWELARKYRKQLSNYGIDFASLPEPPKEPQPDEPNFKVVSRSPKEKYTVTAGDGCIYFQWPKSRISKEIREKVKSFAVREFSWETKKWEVVPHSSEVGKVLSIVAEYGFELGEGVEAILRNASSKPLRYVRVEEEEFVMEFPKNWEIIEFMRANFPGARYDGKGAWRMPVESDNLQALYTLVTDHGFEFDHVVIKTMSSVAKDMVERIEASRSMESDFRIDGLLREPYPFQYAGVEYMAGFDGNGIIADEMGLGKTIQAIALAEHLNTYPYLVVCPAKVKLKWCVEVLKTIPDIKVGYLQGSKLTPKKPVTLSGHKVFVNDLDVNVLVLNWQIVHHHLDELAEAGFQMLILDEIHYMKNPKAQRTDAVVTLANHIDRVLGLSATPEKSRPKELIPPLKVTGILPKLGGAWKFKKRYCDLHQDSWGHWIDTGASNLEELNRRLRQHGFVRRLMDEVFPEMPRFTKSVVPIELSSRRAYDAAVRNPRKFIDEYADEIIEDLSYAFEDLDFKEWDPNDPLVRIGMLRQIAAIGKVKGTVDWIKEFLEDTDEAIVVFADHVRIQKALIEAFPGCAYIRGGVSEKKNFEQQELFQDPNGPRVIICSLKAAAEGIDLVRGSHVAFVQLGWTPADLLQASARIRRIGQTANKLFLHVLEAAGTIEEDIHALVLRKMEILEKSLDGDKEYEKAKIYELNNLVEELEALAA